MKERLNALDGGLEVFGQLIQAKNRSTTHRRAMMAKPTWLSALRTTSMRIGLALATRRPA